MTRAQLLEVLRAAVVRVLEVDPASVSEGTRLVEDLAADSLAIVEIVELLEEELGIAVDDAELDDLETLGDALDLLEVTS